MMLFWKSVKHKLKSLMAMVFKSFHFLYKKCIRLLHFTLLTTALYTKHSKRQLWFKGNPQFVKITTFWTLRKNDSSNPRAVEKWGGGRGQGWVAPAPSPFLGAENSFHVKMENIKFWYENNMWDFSLFIEQDISNKK